MLSLLGKSARFAVLLALTLGVSSVSANGNSGSGKDKSAQIAVAKAAGDVSANADGTYTVEFWVIVQNVGATTLKHVQVTDDIAKAIAPAAVVSVSNHWISGALKEVNTHFDGVNTTMLLSGRESLQPGEAATIDFTLVLDPGAHAGPFYNQAVAMGKHKKTGPWVTVDKSQNGKDPDPDTPGKEPADNPNPDDDNDKTPIVLPPTAGAAIGVAKSIQSIEQVAVDEYRVVIRSVVENLSATKKLLNVTLADDLQATFAGVAGFTVIEPPSGDLTGNPAFNGVTDTALLATGQSLQPGASAQIEFAVRVQTGGYAGPFSNQIVAHADSPIGSVADVSDDGLVPDPDGDGNADEPGENDPSEFRLDPVTLGVAKALTELRQVGPNRYRTDFVLRVANLSDQIEAPNVQLVDDLSVTFAGASDIGVVAPPTVSGGLALANTAFDGTADRNLLAGTEALAPGSLAEVAFAVEFTTATVFTFENSALGKSTTDDGSPLAHDVSDDGAEPDSNGNGRGDDPGESDPTPILLESPVAIGLANALVELEQLDSQTFTATFDVHIENLASSPAPNVQIEDDFTATFGTIPFEIVNVSMAGDLSALNGDYDGSSVAQLLSGNETLAPGAAATVSLVVQFTPDDATGLIGPFSNQPSATANEASTTLAHDLADDGATPDADGDGNANEPGENDPTVFSVEKVRVGVAKALTNVAWLGGDTFDVDLEFNLVNLSQSVPARFVQLADDLATAFPGANITVAAAPSVSGELREVNQGFDGITDVNLLTGAETLAPGAQATLVLNVRVVGVTGDFVNQATMSAARGPAGEPLATDLSDDGTIADSNGNGRADDPGEDDATPVHLAIPTSLSIGVANELAELSEFEPHRMRATFVVRVLNLGPEAPNLQLTDDLGATFASIPDFTVESVTITGDLNALNSAFDGVADPLLLAGDESLPSGGAATLTLVVSFDPGAQLGPFSNQIVATAHSAPTGTPIAEDLSDDGDVVDADGDGNANEESENDPTVFSLDPVAIGAAKSASVTPVPAAGGFDLAFEFVVQNLSATRFAPNLQLTDDLGVAFPNAIVAVLEPPTVTGDLTATNPLFDGLSDLRLLAGTQALPPAGTATIQLAVRVSGVTGTFANQAELTASSPDSGQLDQDLSDSGSAPDPNNNGSASDPGEDDPTEVRLDAEAIGLAKFVATISNNGDGSYRVPLTLTVRNYGSVAITELQIVDDLEDVFAGASFAVAGPPVSATLSVNAAYDGAAQANLLLGTDTLPAGVTGSVSFEVDVTPNAVATFENLAHAFGTTDAGSVSDASTDGEDPDPDGDGNPSNNSEPTPIELTPNPIIGLAKSATTEPASEGSFTANLVFHVQNLGDIGLQNIRIQDDLAAAFAGASFSVEALTSNATTLVPNAGFDGTSDIDLLVASSSSLAVGESAQIVLRVRVVPDESQVEFRNIAFARGTTPGGTTAEDQSTAGVEPDPNEDGNPEEDDPTPIEPPVVPGGQPSVGVAKQALDTSVDASGVLRTTFRIYVENLGSGPANNLQILEDLRAAFPPPAAPSLAANPQITGDLDGLNAAFDGSEDINLLSGTQVLAPGASATIQFTVQVVLNGATGPFANQVEVTGADDDGAPLNDPSDDGTDPDPNDDGDPGGPGEDDPTAVEFPAALVGTVFEDSDVDGIASDAEPRLPAWRVELINVNSETIATTTTDEQGNYAFAGLAPGRHTVRFRHPETAVTWGEPPIELIENTLSRVNFPVAPSGRVYDSGSRALLPGVSLALTDDQGTLIAESCLLSGQQNQTIGSDAAYRFDLQTGGDVKCAASATEYRIRIESTPAGYRPLPSAVIGPANSPLEVATCSVDPDPAQPCVVQRQTRPPMDSESTLYYLAWIFAAGAGNVVNNHIPIDRTTAAAPANLIALNKRATSDTVVIGDLVGYEIRVTNLTGTALTGVEIVDDLPAGFTFVEHSAALRLPGPDQRIDTSDDVVARLTVTGNDPVRFTGIEVAANTTIAIRYSTRVSAGVTQGAYTNTATPVVGANVVGNSASATVAVTSDPLFEQTTVIGKVFADHNEDGWQDPEEFGIPGVRLATVGGLLIETDAHGRYHLAAVDVRRFERGANFIIKLDPKTLPPGAQIISENPRVIRLTQALMSRVNFAIKLPAAAAREVNTPKARVVRNITRIHAARIEPIRFASGQSNIPDSYIDRLRSLLAEYRGKANLRLRFVGHTDNEPLSPRAAAVYRDNQGLSEARAREVAEFMRAELGLDAGMVETAGLADRRSIASNLTPEGMALNRRVEIEVVFDEAIVEERELNPAEAAPETKTEVRQTTNVTQIEPVRFAVADASLTDDQRKNLDANLRDLAEHEIVGLKVIGHADANPLQPGSSFNDNGSLSLRRAQSVASYLATALDLAPQQVTVDSRGAAEPVADNSTVHGRGLNRRAEIEITYRRASERISTRSFQAAPQVSRSFEVNERGRVWMTEDALVRRAQLAVLALEQAVVDANGNMTDPIHFAAYANYGRFADHYRLDIYRADDTDFARPLAAIKQQTLAFPHTFRFLDEALQLQPGSQLAYVLRAYDANGREDATAVQLIDVVRDAGQDLVRREPQNIWATSNLASQSIALNGSRIRIHGEDLAPGDTVRIDGAEVPVDSNGRFVAELHVATGTSDVKVEGTSGDQSWSQTLRPTVDDNYTFVVALANVTVGQQDVSGSFEPLTADDHFDESVFIDGRVALYAKAKVKGKYLITAQLDTTEDELSNISDNLKRKDPRRVFRQLDPDRYYPVYGDDSTTVSDVDTQGAYYLRVDWDKNQLLWGNFNTGLTDTEYLQYNRSLYGARATHQATAQTRFGDAQRTLTAFASEAQSAAGHVTFQATGGSLYYLKHTDIVEGSEKVWVEVRQRDSRQVVERQDLLEGRDYEVDALQGRIILRSPLSPVVNDRAQAIIRSRALEGDDVFLLVDYEYVPVAFAVEDMAYGARAKTWLGDHVAVGASKVVDERAGQDFDLEGIDVTLKASRGTYLNIESATSEATENGANFNSLDGGLSFISLTDTRPNSLDEGDAIAIEGRLDLEELNPGVTGNVRAWWKDRDAGFSAGRLQHRGDALEQGVDAVVQASDDIRVSAGYTEVDEDSVSRSQIGRVQADVSIGDFTIGGEIRHENLERTRMSPSGTQTVAGQALLAGLRVGYDLNEAQTLYGSVQTGLDESGSYLDNDLVALGLNTQVNEHMAVSVEASDGDRGSALSGGVEYSPADHLSFSLESGVGSGAVSQFSGNYQLADGHELYGSYAVDPDRSFGERNLLTLGQRRDFGNRFGIFTETHYGEDDRYSGASHTFGLDYRTEQDWVLRGILTVADNDTLISPLEREALSLGAAVKRADYKFSAKVEYRADTGPSVQTEQYLASSSFTRIVDDNSRWLSKLNVSWTEDELTGGHAARFAEFDVGYAYRPADSDRWNLLTKYGYYYDLVAAAQDALRPDQRAHILSTEGLYRLNPRWEVGAKLALKEGETRTLRDRGQWLDYGVGLALVRGRYHIMRQWDALLEYRYLRDRHAENGKHGALVGLYRHIGDNFKLGVGYNFTDFSDDIRDAEYDNQGWFVDLIGKF